MKHKLKLPAPLLALDLATLPLAFVGCTSTNPKAAFDDVGRHVTARTGQEMRWMRDDTERDEIEKAVAALLQTNLTAQSCVGLALLNNRTLQAEFESIGISQAERAQATRLKNPEFSQLAMAQPRSHRAQRRVCDRPGEVSLQTERAQVTPRAQMISTVMTTANKQQQRKQTV